MKVIMMMAVKKLFHSEPAKTKEMNRSKVPLMRQITDQMTPL
jgi:hypothetical protein